MGSAGPLILFCIAIVGASLLGGAVPAIVGLNHRRLQFGLSFVSGVMLGVAFFHMLPHAAMARMEALEVAAGAAGAAVAAGGAGTAVAAAEHEHSHALFDPIMVAAVVGFVVMFVLERFAHFHQHEIPEPACDSPEHGHAGHTHPPSSGVGRLTWTGAAVGLGIHSCLEGVALAASVAAASELAGGGAGAGAGAGASVGAGAGAGAPEVSLLAGLGTFLVIVLHKPFDALTLTTIYRAGGGTRAQLLLVNVAFAALVPAGVVLFMLGVRATGDAGAIVPYALAFSAGTFLCIAASDLLPEVQFHRHDRAGLSIALILGLALAWGIGRLETLTSEPHASPVHDAAHH